jgi:hypothetical protein
LEKRVSSTAESNKHEGTTISLRGVIWFVVIFIACAIVIHIGLWVMYRAFLARDAQMDVKNSALIADRAIAPEPRLQPSVGHDALPKQDLMNLRAHEDAEFEKRGWTRGPDGNLQIPDAIVTKVVQLSGEKK